MTIKVTVFHKDANQTMDIVRELRAQGLVQGHDFDFAFSQAKYDNDGWEAVTPRQTVFTFYSEKYATLFTLKYGN